jgi:branched-chain amino acid transport system ATP-binding protein
LLDEPFEGLAPLIVEEVERAVERMKSEGLAVLLVEQHVDAALRLCDQTIVLERGRVLHAGASAALREDRVLLESLVALRADGR